MDDDSELSQLFKTFGLGGDKNANQILDNPGNQQLGGSGNMPDTPDPIKLNMPAPTTKQPFNAPMPKPISGISGAGGFPNVGLSSLGMGPSNNNSQPKMPLSMTPPPMPMQNNQSVGSLPGVSQNVNPMIHDGRKQNGLSDADFSFSAEEENEPKYPPQNQQHQNNNFSAGMPKNMFGNTTMNAANNGRSTMGLDTQNKCMCPDCTGGN